MESTIHEFGRPDPGAESTPRPGGYALIFRGGAAEVAVVSTPRGLFLPGGGQEAGESPEEAAVRETQEECGWRILLGERIGAADEFVNVADNSKRYRIQGVFFLAEIAGTSDAAAPEHEPIWLSSEQAIATLCRKSQRWAVATAARLLSEQAGAKSNEVGVSEK
jgi:8-oxo-dGTP diphosphatase